MTRDIFLADAHLLCPDTENYQQLLTFLESQRGRMRTLYILGDLFEFWVGYRHLVFTPYIPLLEKLRSLHCDGTQIVYVEGNHDFHLGPFFRDNLDCLILPDGGTVEIDGKRVFLCHGDRINDRDRGYLLWRGLLRSAPLKAAMALMPGDLTWRVALWASRVSQKGNAAKSKRSLPLGLLEKFARDRLAQGCDVVITGHFHQPLQRDLDQGLLLGLGDWITQYSYAVHENGRFELKTYAL
ncbi:MAG: UDP-2,3-diacylglucosamine diphosphatase [Thermodesulfobacteriota bacterium]|jgi:UDP-2,3-diacylglucosamine hydrolase|nr:UDP-2,3-diacylglucosamine diphosphatase [Thermodesulfobacteriota bacterium]